MSEQFRINTNDFLQKCDRRDVVSLKDQRWVDINKLKDIVYQSFYRSGIGSIVNYVVNSSDLKNKDRVRSWFYKGEECEILQAGSKGWQKGKMKINITLEFIPDEPEETPSPLDDVRQELEQ